MTARMFWTLAAVMLFACASAENLNGNPPKYNAAYVYNNILNQDIRKNLLSPALQPEEFRYLALLHTVFSLGLMLILQNTVQIGDHYPAVYSQAKYLYRRTVRQNNVTEISNFLTAVLDKAEKKYNTTNNLVKSICQPSVLTDKQCNLLVHNSVGTLETAKQSAEIFLEFGKLALHYVKLRPKLEIAAKLDEGQEFLVSNEVAMEPLVTQAAYVLLLLEIIM